MNDITVKGSPKYIELVKNDAGRFFSEMESLFKLKNYPHVTIVLHDSRESFNTKLNRPTKDWEVGNMNNGKKEIDILDPEAFENQSSHSRDEFPLILKHEIAHVFIMASANGHAIPLWLNEGLAMYFSKQTDKYSIKDFNFEENYVSKISTQYGWNKYSGSDAYSFSCLFVNYLIKKYSLDKLIMLLKILDKVYYKKSFNSKFKNIFGIDIYEVESNFVKNTNR